MYVVKAYYTYHQVVGTQRFVFHTKAEHTISLMCITYHQVCQCSSHAFSYTPTACMIEQVHCYVYIVANIFNYVIHTQVSYDTLLARIYSLPELTVSFMHS